MVTVDGDALRGFAREVAAFVPDVAYMLRGVVVDPRVPRSAKLKAGAALAYLVSPKGRVIGMIPVVGQLDEVALLAIAFQRLVAGTDAEILREHWRGSDRAFQVLLGATSALASPAGKLRRAKVVTTVASAALGRMNTSTAWGGRFGGTPRVVDGEVVGRGGEPSASGGDWLRK
jgi:uncharacterized membrane protein YkvA (DUF1232 family)